ncbi:alpha-galactosidase [Microbacterium sp. W1N]|uniref:alpha-galactosidase n=1 Tax=Microbacterium festucae TaxID=2977531 RepID=UPI0021BFF8CD|nr:alpha-galactosidase [Microbacterium festucae]MCT9818826.1 alpha-galactosidase [Microbacterium festucae]
MIHHLRAAGVSLVVDSRGARVPAISHWGADLGEVSPADLAAFVDAREPAVGPSSIDAPLRHTLVPTLSDGWSGLPAVSSDAGATAAAIDTRRDGQRLLVRAALGALRVDTALELTPQGVLVATRSVTNTADRDVRVDAAAVTLPVPDRAREVLDFTGRWTQERRPQRTRPGHGVWLRESRHGRGGHDDAFLFIAGTPGFGFGHGEVWSTHVAFSGDTRQWIERSPLGASVLGAGERLSGVVLAPGETLEVAPVVATYSGAGLDGLSDRLHPWIRSWAAPRRPRPITANTWEAVYFDQSFDKLAPLVDAAADIGVERFVLDDGWFHGRTDDRRALGDWTVDAGRWPDGLGPLVARVAAAGMEFGLWVEPEMVSLDSDLARAHPEWLLTDPAAVTWRWQHVLDLARDDVRAHLFARLDALLRAHPIRYLKWDHNRDLLVDGSRAQVLGLYRLLDDLRAAHPDVEIESCASGGARIDLGILRRVDRVWTSDANDPWERQLIQRWTGILIPPEYLGSHVGDARSHTTGRTTDLSFRLATALFGHAGVESDISRLPAADRDALRAWTGFHRAHRDLLHAGRVVRADDVDDAVLVHGVVAPGAGEALYSYAVVGGTDAALPAPAALPGLDPERRYRVRPVSFGADAGAVQDAPPPWLAHGTVLPGRMLAAGALAMPLLIPGSAMVLHVTADDDAPAGSDPGAPHD